MSLSLKRLALSLTLLAIGGGAGLWVVAIFQQRRADLQLTTVPVAVPPVSGRAFPSGELVERVATTVHCDSGGKVGPAVN